MTVSRIKNDDKENGKEDGVFQRVIGNGFSQLPVSLQRIHDTRQQLTLQGYCDVQRGKGIVISLMAWMASLPPTGADIPLSVKITRDAKGETKSEIWLRNFNGHEMRSRLWLRNSLLAERLGLVTLLFSLSEHDGKIEWCVCGARLLGMPLPMSWFTKSRATEQCVNDRYTFDVRAELPIVGLLVHYRGWLAEHE